MRLSGALWFAGLALGSGWTATAASCSLQNREGPRVTCADLDCGRLNACEDGIIAQCLDGVTVRYHVCESDDDTLCGDDWQVPGQYRCTEHHTQCEGCRPEGPGCLPAPEAEDGGTGGAAGSSR